VALTVAQLAQLHGVTADHMAEITSLNARRLFALPASASPTSI
jgi:Tat protein secretion system quality control protein TatD with DNase activity